MTLIAYHPNGLQRVALRLAATRWAGELLRRILPPLDRQVLTLSRGRHTLSGVLTGLPVIWLTTTGVKSGLPRTTPLLAGVDGERLVVFPTNFGGQQSPSWLYNLRANPQATVTFQGAVQPYLAREATGSEQEAYWKLGESFYPGYAAYRRRVRGRHIPVVVLEPAAAQE